MIVRCKIDGCKNPAHARGLCSRHYMRQRRHGDPQAVERPGPKQAEFLRLLQRQAGAERTWDRELQRFLQATSAAVTRNELDPSDVDVLAKLADLLKNEVRSSR